MAEALHNSLDVLAGERTKKELQGLNLRPVPDRLALNTLARHIGLSDRDLPEDIRILVGLYTHGDSGAADLVRFPVPKNSNESPERLHDVHVSIPTLTAQHLTLGIADALFYHPVLSPATTRFYDDQRGRRVSCASLAAYGAGVMALGNFAPDPTRPITLVTGVVIAAAGAIGIAREPFQDRAPVCPSVDGMEPPIDLVLLR